MLSCDPWTAFHLTISVVKFFRIRFVAYWLIILLIVLVKGWGVVIVRLPIEGFLPVHFGDSCIIKSQWGHLVTSPLGCKVTGVLEGVMPTTKHVSFLTILINKFLGKNELSPHGFNLVGVSRVERDLFFSCNSIF